MPQAIVIKAGEQPIVKDVTDIRAELDGGWLQGIPFTHETMAFVDEEGKLKGLPVNEVATQLCETFKVGLAPDDVIVGTFILVGTLDGNGIQDGENHPVPETLVEQIVEPTEGVSI